MPPGGAGIFNRGEVTLNGSSSSSHNTAFDDGGGIFNSFGSEIILNGGSSIHHNTAGDDGGI